MSSCQNQVKARVYLTPCMSMAAFVKEVASSPLLLVIPITSVTGRLATGSHF